MRFFEKDTAEKKIIQIKLLRLRAFGAFDELSPQKPATFRIEKIMWVMKTGTKEVSKHPINPIHRDLIIVLVTSLGVAALVVAIGVLIFG